jgi:hypothetical protein
MMEQPDAGAEFGLISALEPSSIVDLRLHRRSSDDRRPDDAVGGDAVAEPIRR